MATFEKRGKRWRVQLYRAGHRLSATFHTKAEAAAWALENEARLKHGRLPNKTIGDALRKYAEDVSPGKRGARWEVVRLTKLSKDPFAKVKLVDVGPDTITEWRDRRLQKVSGPSVAREMNLLVSVFRVARLEWRWLHDDPMADVRKPRRSRPRRRRVTQDEVDRIRLALGYAEDGKPVNAAQRVAIAFLLAIETGMRAGELTTIETHQVHLPERFVHLDKTKNGDERNVPLSKRAGELFGWLLDSSPDSGPLLGLNPGTRDVLFRRARETAKIDNLHFHDSRSEAIWRLSKKLDVLQLARVIGHRDIKSLMFYYDEHASETAKLLDDPSDEAPSTGQPPTPSIAADQTRPADSASGSQAKARGVRGRSGASR